MKQRKSYEKDEFTTVIESLSTSSEDEAEAQEEMQETREAPFPRDEAHVTILSEIEKRLNQFPTKLVLGSGVVGGVAGTADTALVLYRSPESMGLPPLERQRQEEAKAMIRRRIMERRRLDKMGIVSDGERRIHVQDLDGEQEEEEGDGYEADAEDLEDDIHTSPVPGMVNGYHGYRNQVEDDDDDDDDDDGEMMDLD